MIDADPTSADFNCYCTYDEATVLVGNRLYSTNWNAAAETTQKRALLTATQVLDYLVKWKGYVAESTQPLAWPRSGVQKADRVSGTYFEETEIPDFLKLAVVLMAERLLGEDLLADQETGLSGLSVGSIALRFSSGDRKSPLPMEVMSLIDPYVSYTRTGKSGEVRLVRA